MFASVKSKCGIFFASSLELQVRQADRNVVIDENLVTRLSHAVPQTNYLDSNLTSDKT